MAVTISTHHFLCGFKEDCVRKLLDSKLAVQVARPQGTVRKLPFLPQQILLSWKEVALPWCFMFFPLHCFLSSPPPALPPNFSRYLASKCQKGAWHYKALELHKIFRELFECHKSIAHVQMILFQSSRTVRLDHIHDHYWFISDVHARLLLLTYMFNELLSFRGIELFDVCSQKRY